MRDIHDQAEAYSLRWVRIYRGQYPDNTPGAALTAMGVRGGDWSKAGWDDVVCECARRWLAEQRKPKPAAFRQSGDTGQIE